MAYEDAKTLSDLEVTVYLEYLKEQKVISDYELGAKSSTATLAGRSSFSDYNHTIKLKGVVKDPDTLKRIQQDPDLVKQIPFRTYPRSLIEKLIKARDSITNLVVLLCGIPPADTPQIAIILEILRTLKGVDLEQGQDRIMDFMRDYGFLERYAFKTPSRLNSGINARVPIGYSCKAEDSPFVSNKVLCLAQIHATLYIPIENIPTALEQFKEQPLLKEIIQTRLEKGVE